jgi:hypothetical protein
MGFTYEIVYVNEIDISTGLPKVYAGSSIPSTMMRFLKNAERWSIDFAKLILGGDLSYSELAPVQDLLDILPSYDEIVEELVDQKAERYWTRETHEAFVNALRFFAEHGFFIRYHC